MIKLDRKYTPIKLTPTFVKDKTEQYKQTKEAVWNLDWLKESLLEDNYEYTLTKNTDILYQFPSKKYIA